MAGWLRRLFGRDIAGSPDQGLFGQTKGTSSEDNISGRVSRFFESLRDWVQGTVFVAMTAATLSGSESITHVSVGIAL